MKIKLLMIGLWGLVSAATFAQTRDLKNAQESYDAYDVAKGQPSPVLVAKAKSSIADAKVSIDKAVTNEKNAALPQTYALKGAIYGALALQDSVPANTAPLLTTAQEAIKKAKEMDTKGDFKKLIADANNYIAIYYNTAGVKQYQAGKYELAYQSFDNWNQAQPDTTALYYGALAASNAGTTNPKFYPYAITNYNKLLTTTYSGNSKIYTYLATLYMVTKDTANALKTASAGVAKYPGSAELQELQVRLALQAGKENSILGTIEGAIANDPKNKTLYYYAALTYSRIGDAEDDKASKAKDPAAKATLNKSALENYSKASDYYKKALAIDADYFDANLNLGYVLMKPAIDTYNAANNLPSNATQKQYDDLRYQADAQFELAKPYLQKAVDLNPKSKDALYNLRNYYKGKYDKANAAANKQKADDLKKQMDAL
jgi:tetratricopeptide (TPR) repeat protein